MVCTSKVPSGFEGTTLILASLQSMMHFLICADTAQLTYLPRQLTSSTFQPSKDPLSSGLKTVRVKGLRTFGL